MVVRILTEPVISPIYFDRLAILVMAMMILVSTVVCIDEMQMARTARKGKEHIFDESILDDLDQDFTDIVKRAQEDIPEPRPDEGDLPAADYQNLSESENLSQSIGDIKKGF